MSAPPVTSFSVKDPIRSGLIKVSKTTKNSAKQGFPTFGFPRVGFRSHLGTLGSILVVWEGPGAGLEC